MIKSARCKPDGLLVVPPGEELSFLHPLPVERLWGVGRVTAGKLHAAGLATVGQLAELEERTLVSLLGRASGHHLHALAHNRDPRRVEGRRRRRSIGSQRAMGRRRRSPAELDTYLIGLVERVTRRMRAADRVGRTVTLRLRFDDFTRATRSETLLMPTASTDSVLKIARQLLAEAQPLIRTQGLTLIGLSVSNLTNSDVIQLALPLDRPGFQALDGVMDDLKKRFGNDAVGRAVLQGRDPGLTMPMLPD